MKIVHNYIEKRLCKLLLFSNLKVVNNDKNTFIIHNLKTNFDKIFGITKSFFTDSINADCNFRFYPNKPKISDCEIITLSILCESIGIDSENSLFGKLKSDHSLDFPNLISRSRFNRRRKQLGTQISKLNEKICKEDYETAPDKGYSAVSKSWYYGYKLHLVTSVRGVFSSMDLTKASVHNIHYLNDIKHSGLNNCTLIADKGYLSKPYQMDLFNIRQIRLETPKRSNQHDKEPYSYIFKKSRKRIETLFAQLCDQQMLKRNYAKTRAGISVRVLCKITSVTMLQYINSINNKPINHLKYALAS